MTTIEIKGKKLTAIEIEPTVVGTSQQYAQQAKQYRDETEAMMNTVLNTTKNFNDTVTSNINQLNTLQDEIEENLTDYGIEIYSELQAKANELLREVDNQLAEITGE